MVDNVTTVTQSIHYMLLTCLKIPMLLISCTVSDVCSITLYAHSISLLLYNCDWYIRCWMTPQWTRLSFKKLNLVEWKGHFLFEVIQWCLLTVLSVHCTWGAVNILAYWNKNICSFKEYLIIRYIKVSVYCYSFSSKFAAYLNLSVISQGSVETLHYLVV